MLFKITLLLGMLITTPSFCQGFDLTNKNNKDDINLTADESLEWQQNEKVIIAVKNAIASKGETSLKADVLKAFYREFNKKNDIFLVKGNGNIEIKTLTETGFGNEITYDIDQAVMVLKGSPATVETKGNTLTSDIFEYWQERKIAVSRGNAKLVKGDDKKQVTAKLMVAHFDENKQKNLEINYIDFFDDIVFTGEDEKIYANRARYNLKTSIIRLEGNIKLEKGRNILTGAFATVNMKTGISKLVKSGTDKVRGVFIPEKYNEEAKNSSENDEVTNKEEETKKDEQS